MAQLLYSYLHLVEAFLLLCGVACSGDDVGMRSIISEATAPGFPQKQPFGIEHIENGPEVLVNIPGIDSPLCFDLEVKEETLRIIQDPKTGVIVNAQIFYDSTSNKTYIGATLVAKDSICVIATQYVVLVNNARFNWGETRVMNLDGHRVVIRKDVVVITFRQCQISLVIQRHYAARENTIDYNEEGKEISSKLNGSNVSDTGDKEDTESGNQPFSLPVIGYAESEAIINQYLSSKRRRGILLQKFFGINQDGAVVRNAIIELESEGLKKRADVHEDVNISPENAITGVQDSAQEQLKESNQENSEKDESRTNQKKNKQERSHRRRRQNSRSQPEYKFESLTKREAERKRDSTVFLDISIVDAGDFSNKTHGLLGQFLVKSVTREKIRYKDGKITVRLLVQENPSRRTNALYTSRPNVAMNVTRACWKVRHHGRDMLDGNYSDYAVPNIWYRNMKELPPPAPL